MLMQGVGIRNHQMISSVAIVRQHGGGDHASLGLYASGFGNLVALLWIRNHQLFIDILKKGVVGTSMGLNDELHTRRFK